VCVQKSVRTDHLGRGYHSRKGRPWECELVVIETDFYNDVAKYFGEFLVDNPNNLQSLEDIIAWNIEHTDVEGGVPGTHPAWPSGQDLFDDCAKIEGHEGEHYHSAMRYLRTKSREEGIDAALRTLENKNGVDGDGEDDMLGGLLVPVQADRLGAIQVAAKAGYPVITIPIGVEPSTGVPFGIGIIHTLGQERKLLKYGAAIEDLVRGRTKPTFRNPNADNYQLV
jgi:amidase